jgi:hypothetical protein
MATWYSLVNFTRAETIDFAHIPVATKRELAGNPVAAAIATWYLLEHPGDSIAFVSDTDGDWPFPSGSPSDLEDYQDVTQLVADNLVAIGILRDDGREIFDKSEPDVYMRLLHNVWLD